MNNRITAFYYIETPFPLDQAAESIAGEQSTGTFIKVPGETEELREKYRARVEEIIPLDEVNSPSLMGVKIPSGVSHPVKYQRAMFKISFPVETVGTQLTTVMSTVGGNLYELREFSGLKLMDIDLPDDFQKNYPGPQFGITGTRELSGVFDRPLIGTIIKPSVGLSPQQTADLVKQLAEADIDFIKDDELMANPPHSPFEDRVHAIMNVINAHAERTGKKVMYAFNISDEIDDMLRHHDTVLKAGGTCVMMSLNSVGLAAVSHIRKQCQLPIHAHRNGWGMLTRHPLLGISFKAYQKIWRAVGVDHLHVNGLQNKFWEPDDSVVESIEACKAPFMGGYYILPVVSSGQWGGQAPDTYQRVKTVDLMYLAGGGIMAHPGGPAAGVTSLRQAWEAAVLGISVEEYAKDHPELRQSIEKFGKKSTA